MTTYENECCDCKVSGYPCRGIACPMRHVKHVYCDKCGDEMIGWYRYNDKDLCQDCLIEILKKDEVIQGVGYDDS